MPEYKVANLKKGMKDVDITVQIDFLGNQSPAGYGDSYIQGYVKDETGEMRMTFWGSDIAKAKKAKKVIVKKGYVTEYKGELQLNADRKVPLEFKK